VISVDVFGAVGVRPVRCIGVAALSLSAWEACGGAAGLVAAIKAANAAGGGAISLAPRCTYTLTAADNNSSAATACR
jgi:hypothetical protein